MKPPYGLTVAQERDWWCEKYFDISDKLEALTDFHKVDFSSEFEHYIYQETNLTFGQIRVVMKLFQANGRTLNVSQIEENLSSKKNEYRSDVTSVHVCKIRKLFPNWIKTVWGRGFVMTPDGISDLRALEQKHKTTWVRDEAC